MASRPTEATWPSRRCHAPSIAAYAACEIAETRGVVVSKDEDMAKLESTRSRIHRRTARVMRIRGLLAALYDLV
ncbi:hypothetical protein VTI74DRAFT_10511 [Chaetomium olivicolor]